MTPATLDVLVPITLDRKPSTDPTSDHVDYINESLGLKFRFYGDGPQPAEHGTRGRVSVHYKHTDLVYNYITHAIPAVFQALYRESQIRTDQGRQLSDLDAKLTRLTNFLYRHYWDKGVTGPWIDSVDMAIHFLRIERARWRIRVADWFRRIGHRGTFRGLKPAGRGAGMNTGKEDGNGSAVD